MAEIEKSMIEGLIPVRKPDTNKGDYGRVLIVTGSAGMTGSGCLCATSALLSGAGLVYVAVPDTLSQIYCLKLIEPIIIKIPSVNDAMALRGLSSLKNASADKDVIILGPGLGRSFTTGRLVEEFLRQCERSMVIDADGLNLICGLNVLGNTKAPVIITPHPGEMARLCGLTIKEVQNDRIKVATEFSKEYNVIVVLKGSGTVVAAPDGRYFINTTGNAGMATAGTGDVLAGLIGGLLGQGLKPLDAAMSGVFIHGAAGDLAAESKGQHGITASDVAESIPYYMKSLIDDTLVKRMQ